MTNTLAYLDGVEITIEALRYFPLKIYIFNFNEKTLFNLAKPKT
jgi:hypothetical protein